MRSILLVCASREVHHQPPEQVDVVIIGAGSASLSTAARLEEFAENVTYIVLVAQGRGGHHNAREALFRGWATPAAAISPHLDFTS
eukprot:scaffold71398_cov41-Cyclotella_meneghiniana.AAC.6